MAVQRKPWQTVGENCHDFTSLLSPQCGVNSWELLDKKLKSPLFTGAGGPCLQMTNA